MDENGLYAKQTCNLAGVLTTCTSEACESEIKYIRATEVRDRHHTYTCFPVEYPRASVNARMGLHIVSLATLMNLISSMSVIYHE